MRNKRLLLSFFAAAMAALLVFLPFSALAEGDGTEDIPLDMADGYLIATPVNDKILKSSDLMQKLSPASTVKMMSGLILCEAYGGRLEEKITVTEAMVKDVAGRSAGIRAGQTPTVRDLLYLAFCGGFNDAIRILGTAEFGSDAALVTEMNRRAAALGMSSTLYMNATGVSAEGMVTTVGDLYRLACANYTNTLFMTVTSAAAYTTEGLPKPFAFENYNRIVTAGKYRNPICRGMNAGSTPDSGYALVTAAEKNGQCYLCIVLGAREEKDTVYSYVIANQLIAWGLNSYGTKTLFSTSDVICEIPVTNSAKTASVIAVPEEEISSFVPLSYTVGKEITYSYELSAASLPAPVTVGDRVGTLTVFCDGAKLTTVPLVAKTGAEKSDLLEAIEKVRVFSQSDFFIGALITAAVLTFLWITVKSVVRGSRRKKQPRL